MLATNSWKSHDTASLCCKCDVASGTLVSYLLLRELRRRDGPMHINWIIVVVHRYWRYVTYLIFKMCRLTTQHTINNDVVAERKVHS